jgi:hypothetical protein
MDARALDVLLDVFWQIGRDSVKRSRRKRLIYKDFC